MGLQDGKVALVTGVGRGIGAGGSTAAGPGARPWILDDELLATDAARVAQERFTPGLTLSPTLEK
jgi:NAD(P)-dependent dehydrogenase (short-subunit alcohol dehydrogenase family)